MTFIRNSSGLILCLLLFSCQEPSTLSGFGHATYLTGEEIEIDFTSIAFPNFNLFLCKNYLIFADSKSDYWVKVIDLYKSKLISELGRKGRGPNEINFVYSLSNIPSSDNLFFVNDAPNKQVQIFNIDSIVLGITEPCQRILMKDKNIIRDIIPLDNNRYLSDNLNSKEYCLALYDKDFTLVSEGLRYPEGVLDKLMMLRRDVWSAAFNPGISFNKAGDRFCCYIKDTDFLELFSVDSLGIKSTFRSFTYLPEYVITSPFRYSFDNIRGGILFCTCTDRYIYCLAYNHSNKLEIEDFKKGEYYIYVFNWDGKPVKLIKLDRRIFLFEVDRVDKYLYALTYGEEIQKLLKYEL